MGGCPDDDQLVAFVEHTLEAGERDRLELHVHACDRCREALALAVAAGPPTVEPPHDELIGRFVLRGVLGVGGMGVVYEAYDPELDRKVAIKLLHSGIGDARQRLLREAQALAKIDHANVIKVHDVGSHDDQVYIAMELADAGTLRAWLRAKPPVREIVAELVQAGRGLAAAHAAGLVHRDFKPDNVLRFRGGRVCVTDFGLVGVERAPSSDVSTTAPAPPAAVAASPGLAGELTRTGSVMGTPLYMSPEQFAGRPATAASDQFSFCVALYEAVYGGHPFGGTTFAELAQTIASGTIAPVPDRARVPAWMRRALVRGLSTDPARRFPTMTALLDELARDRRRRTLAGGAAIAAFVASGAIVVALRPSGPACGDGADQLAHVWNPVRSIALETSFLASARPHAADTFSRFAPLVDRWSAAWKLGRRDACEATRVRGERSDHALDVRMACLDDKLREVGATLDAVASGGGIAIDHALEAALRFPSLAPCARGDDVAVRPEGAVAIVQVQAVRARIDQASAELVLGRYGDARTRMTGALEAARTTGYRPLIGEAARVLGEAQLKLADRNAVDSFRSAIHLARELRDSEAEVDASAGLVLALTTLEGKYEVALEIAQLADAAAASSHAGAQLLGKLDDARGDLELARGRPALASTRYGQALARSERELGPDHIAVLTSLERLGHVLVVQGKFADARSRFERVLATRQRLEAPGHPDLGDALDNLGSVARAESKLDEADALYNRALAIRIAALGADHPAVAASYNNLGALAAERGDPKQALASFTKAIALYERVFGAQSVEVASALTNLGNALVTMRELAGAIPALERARAIYEARLDANDPRAAYVTSELGVIAERQGKLDDALALIRRAAQLEIAAVGPDHPDVADYLEREASVLSSQNKLGEAEPLLVRAIEIYRKGYGGDHPRVAMALGALAQLQGQRGDYQTALASWQQALPILSNTLPADHPNLTFALAGIGDALTELGRAPEAVPYLERALAIREHAHMPDALVAEIHFYLAAALVTAPATHARALREARTALAMYTRAGDQDDARQLETWLASHH